MKNDSARTFNINGYDLVKWYSNYDIDRCKWTITIEVCQPFAGLFGVAPDDICVFYDYMDEDPREVDFDHMVCIILRDLYRELAKVSQEVAAAYAKKLEDKHD